MTSTIWPTNSTANMSNWTGCTAAEEADEAGPGRYVAGIVLAFVGSSFESLGLSVQSLAQKTEAKQARAQRRPETTYVKLRLWWVGFVVFALGNGLDMAALGLVSPAIVVLVGSWALCLNLFTASKILGERREMGDYMAVCFIIVGIITAVAGRPVDDTIWTITAEDHCGTACDSEGLSERFSEPGAVATYCILLVLTFASIFAVIRMGRHGCCGVGGAREGVEKAQLSGFVKFLYVAQAALVACVTVSTARAVSSMFFAAGLKCELAGETITYGNQFQGSAFLFFAVFLVSLPAQIHFIALSLAINDMLVHIPVFYVIWQVGTATFGGIIYKEYRDFTAANFLLYIAGVAVMFGGIFLATKRLAAIETKADGGGLSESLTDLEHLSEDDREDTGQPRRSGSGLGSLCPTDAGARGVVGDDRLLLDHSSM